MSKHFIATAGLHGYMPNVCEVYDSIRDAAESMASIHDLGKNRTARLRKDCYLELDLHRDGNEYIEISVCNCGNPEIHNDY